MYSIHYEYFTGIYCYCHRLSTKEGWVVVVMLYYLVVYLCCISVLVTAL
jgi:hypothetical protein